MKLIAICKWRAENSTLSLEIKKVSTTAKSFLLKLDTIFLRSHDIKYIYIIPRVLCITELQKQNKIFIRNSREMLSLTMFKLNKQFWLYLLMLILDVYALKKCYKSLPQHLNLLELDT